MESIVPASKPLYRATTWAPGARMSSATLSNSAWVSFSWTGASGILSTTVASPASDAPSICAGKSAATNSFSSPAVDFSRCQSVGPSSSNSSASASTARDNFAAASKMVKNCSVNRCVFTSRSWASTTHSRDSAACHALRHRPGSSRHGNRKFFGQRRQRQRSRPVPARWPNRVGPLATHWVADETRRPRVRELSFAPGAV